MMAVARRTRPLRWWMPAAAALAGLVGFVLVIASLIADLSALSSACDSTAAAPGLPEAFMPYFAGAAAQFGLGTTGWAYLAAINDVESDFDDTGLPGVASGSNPFGAAGPMQIAIGGAAGDTWAHVEVSGVPGGASPPSVYDEADAVYAAANLLGSDGAPRDWRDAIFAYNHATWYVDEVTSLATEYAASASASAPPSGSGGSCASATTAPDAVSVPAVSGTAPAILADGVAAIPLGAPAAVQEMLAAGDRIIDEPYSYGGGHSPASMGVPPEPGADPGDGENGGPGYDCSSAVDYVLWGAGLGETLLGGAVPPSQALAHAGDPGPGRWVTIYAGSSGGQPHAFIAVDGIVLDTVHLEPATPAGTGPRWQAAAEVEQELASGQFVARHPPGL
jgi:hypothetical protein